MLLAVRISSYGCTWEVWRAFKKLEMLSAVPRATLTLLSCSQNFLRASITRYTHAKHEPILKSHTLKDSSNIRKSRPRYLTDLAEILHVVLLWGPNYEMDVSKFW